jgi:hypothetical protein
MTIAKGGALVLPMRTDELIDLATGSEVVLKTLGVERPCTKRDSGKEKTKGEDIARNPDMWWELVAEPRGDVL